MDEPVLLEGTGSLFELVPRVRWETDFERFASLRRHATDARTREASAPSLLELPGIASRWLRHAAAGVASISEGLVVSRTLTRTLIRALERINQCPWQIALSPCGQFLALLQDDRVEIAKRDTDFDFGRPLATVELDFDPFRPWRRLAWSHDSKLVAVAGSDGAVDVVSIAGHHLATILNEGPEGPSDLPSRDRRRHFVDSRSGGSFAMGNVGILDPVAVLEFADPSLRRESSESAELAAGTSSELLVIGYDGLLRSYLIDGSRITVPARVPGSDQAYGSMVTVFQEGSDDAMGIVRFDHAFSFAPYHTVVAAGLVDRDTKVLVLCGRPGPRSSPSAQDDLSFWRLGGARQRYEKLGGGAPDSPSSGIASKLAGVLDKATELVSPRLTILSASLAPDRKLLATVGSAGELRIWSYATGRCVREYGREELAGLVDYLPEENLAELLRVRRVPADGDGDLAEQGHDADDAGEWSDDDEFGRGDLKSSSRTGTVTSVTSVASAASRIVSVAEGQQGATDPLNLPLLTSAQWWSPQSILLTFDTGHVMLVDLFADMETRSVLNLRFPTPPVAAVEPESAMFLTYQDATNEPKKSPNSDAASNIVTGPIKLVTNVMLWHWETEDTLVPPPGHQPKPPRLNYCTIEVTNPEEALRNRIRHGQYAAALDLCAAFNLDSDPVYKAQFETNEVTVESIDNVLGRIRDDYFVMEACVGRVPDDPETCRALLEFGLRKTGLEGDMLVDDVLELLEIESRRLEEGEEFGSDMLMVDMCRYRTDILIYLDRLRTFELIGPGRKSRARDGLPRTTSSSEIGLTSLRRMPSKPQGKAWPQFAAGFTRFRDRKLLSECADRALRCDFYALEVLFTRHGEQLLPHRLDILKVVPETVDPVSYSVLLPRVTAEGNEEPWQEHPWRDGPDWVEDQRVVAFLERGLGGPPIGEGKPVRPYPASGEAVRDWFIERIRSVDVESGLERTALSLAEVAVDDCGVIDPQMLLLRDNLRTLCHLLYETVSEGSAESGKLSLATFESMEPKDVVRLMLANVDADHIVAAVREVLSYPSDVVRRRWEDLGKVADSQVIVRSWLREAAADRRLELCCEIVEAATSRSDEPLELLRIGSDEDITELIIDCCYLCPDVDDHAMAFMNRMFDCLPEISRLERSVPKPEGGRQLLVAGDDLAGPYAERIRALDHHLVCCEILSRAGVSVPPSALAGFESDADKQLALLKKVARRAPRRRRTGQIGDREEDEEATRAEKLIGDLLVLKDFGVLDKIDTSVIYREILSSVLAAGEFETAKDLIASNAYPLPDEVAEELVLAAASEFFDNAESGERTEGGLKMAEDCLEIIPQTPRIRKELDLILATDELFRYKVWLKEGLDILPIQVRLCEDRLDLVQKRIRSDRNSPYRADRIVTLAHRLGYRGNKRAEAHVQAMLVEAALDNSDFVKASELCSNMMNGIRSSGLELDLLPRDVWSVCYRLGSADKFSNVDVRLDIVSFALCLSPEDKVAELLETHARLEQMLRVEELSDPARTVVHGLRKSSDAAVPVIWRRGSSVPFDASQALEDIKATLALLPADLSTAEDSASGVVQSEFYRAAHATPDAANSAYGFFAVDKPRDLQHLSRKERAEQNTTLRRSADRVLLKLATMDETNAGTAESTLASLAFGVLPVDTAGAVSLLLDTAKEETAQSVFDRLYPSSFNEQLALYYYSLRSLTDLADSTKADLVPRSFSPYEVMRFIGQLAGDPAWEAALVRAEKSGEPGFAAAREAVENVRRASKALRSKREDQLLQIACDRFSISRSRFEEEDGYRKEAILRILQIGDAQWFSNGLFLGATWSMSRADLISAYLSWLFLDSGLEGEAMDQRLRLTTEIVLEDTDSILPSLLSIHGRIPGDAYGVLLTYYRFLRSFISGESPESIQLDGRESLLADLVGVDGLQRHSFRVLVAANYGDTKGMVSLLAGMCSDLISPEPVVAVLPGILDLRFCAILPDEGADELNAATDMDLGGIVSTFSLAHAETLLQRALAEGDSRRTETELVACEHLLSNMLVPELSAFGRLVGVGEEAQRIPLKYRLSLASETVNLFRERYTDNAAELVAAEAIFNHVKAVADCAGLTDPSTGSKLGPEFLTRIDSAFSDPETWVMVCEAMVRDRLSPYIVHGVVTALARVPNLGAAAVEKLDTSQLYCDALKEAASVDPDSSLPNLSAIVSSVITYETPSDLPPAEYQWLAILEEAMIGALRALSGDASLEPARRRTIMTVVNRDFVLKEEEVTELRALRLQAVIRDAFGKEVPASDLSKTEKRLNVVLSLLEELEQEDPAKIDALRAVLDDFTDEEADGAEGVLPDYLHAGWAYFLKWLLGRGMASAVYEILLSNRRTALITEEEEQEILSILLNGGEDDGPYLTTGLLSHHAGTLDRLRAHLSSSQNPAPRHQRLLHILVALRDLLHLVPQSLRSAACGTLLRIPRGADAAPYRALLQHIVASLVSSGDYSASSHLVAGFFAHPGLESGGLRGRLSLVSRVLAGPAEAVPPPGLHPLAGAERTAAELEHWTIAALLPDAAGAEELAARARARIAGLRDSWT